MSTQEHGGASPVNPAGSGPVNPAGQGPPNPPGQGPLNPAEPVRLDLDELRGELAASPGAARLRSLDLGRIIEGDGALDELARAVAEFPGSGAGAVVLAAATPMTVAGRDLQAEATEVLGRGFGVDWVTLGPPDGQVHADEPTVAAACQAARGAGCVVTIGSGTITDIGKLAAGRS